MDRPTSRVRSGRLTRRRRTRCRQRGVSSSPWAPSPTVGCAPMATESLHIIFQGGASRSSRPATTIVTAPCAPRSMRGSGVMPPCADGLVLRWGCVCVMGYWAFFLSFFLSFSFSLPYFFLSLLEWKRRRKRVFRFPLPFVVAVSLSLLFSSFFLSFCVMLAPSGRDVRRACNLQTAFVTL